MPVSSARLILPRPALRGCIAAAIERDTRGMQLSHQERLNYYPATPFPTVSLVLDGTLYLLQCGAGVKGEGVALGQPLPKLMLAGPHSRPSASWAPGPVHALMVGFYPEALRRFLCVPLKSLRNQIVPLEQVVTAQFLHTCQQISSSGTGVHLLSALEDALAPQWSVQKEGHPALQVADWLRMLTARATSSSTGISVRQAQRRLKDWTGQSRQELQLFVRLEQAFALRGADHTHPAELAQLADASGYADQSHMGREVRRVTGWPPGQFNALVARHEAFWYYRLLEQQYLDTGLPEGE